MRSQLTTFVVQIEFPNILSVHTDRILMCTDVANGE